MLNILTFCKFVMLVCSLNKNQSYHRQPGNTCHIFIDVEKGLALVEFISISMCCLIDARASYQCCDGR